MSFLRGASDTVETLSAYLDDELSARDRARLERRLEDDPELRRQLAGLRAVTSGLGHLERLAPPPTLGQDVARRIALAGEKRGLMDRIEGGLGGAPSQSNLFLMFAVIVALALIMFFFSQGLEQNALTPVTFDDPARSEQFAAPEPIENATTLLVADRLFQRRGELWVEDGVDPAAAGDARRLDLAAAPELLERYPELRSVAWLGRALLRLDGEIVLVASASADD